MEKKRVVFYGRVSTQSEEQLSAFDNQMTWYQQLLQQHPEWTIVGQYEDAGVTGTSVRKRKGFRQMLDDGIKLHKYDMIVTRETKRFARNTVDALSYVRLLKQHGIEVFFVSDAIRTISDHDGELRLSIMATIAQEESRKISENVRAGQKISRQKGILRGNGNILGYRRTGRNQYEIDPEQAITVKKIYQWYLEGHGIRVIKRMLEEEGTLTATGKSIWQFEVISEILKNPFYTGKQLQMRKVSDGYLTQRRRKNQPEKMEYIAGNYEPIISVEMFEEVQRLRKSRYNQKKNRGRKASQSVWCGKYLCGCGCGTIRRNNHGDEHYFICHWQHMQGVKTAASGNGKEEICTLKTTAEWKLDMMAYQVINDVWKKKDDDMKKALDIIAECYQEEHGLDIQEADILHAKIQKLENRKQKLLDMRADGEISKEEYIEKKEEYQSAISKLRLSLAASEQGRIREKDLRQTISRIKASLETIMDLSQPKLNPDIVDGFIWKIVHTADYAYDIYLSMGNDRFGRIGAEEKVIRYKSFEYPNPQKEERIRCTQLKTMVLTYEDAVRYRAISGKRVIKSKWKDLCVHIYI